MRGPSGHQDTAVSGRARLFASRRPGHVARIAHPLPLAVVAFATSGDTDIRRASAPGVHHLFATAIDGPGALVFDRAANLYVASYAGPGCDCGKGKVLVCHGA